MVWGITNWVTTKTPDQSQPQQDPPKTVEPVGVGLAAVQQVGGDNDVAVDEIAGLVLKYPGERDAIFRWLQEHRGNRFTQAVVVKAQPKNVADSKPTSDKTVKDDKAVKDDDIQIQPTVGNQYIDHGAKCAEGGDDCFLEADQRTRLINGYQLRVQTAQQAYREALNSIHVDQLFKKLENDQKANLPWLLSLAIDVIGAHALTALTSTLANLIHMEKQNLALVYNAAEKGSRLEAISKKMTAGLEKITPAKLASLSKKAADAATKTTKSKVTKATKDGSHSVQNAIDTNYIEYLMDNASPTFQALSEGPPGYADDAELVTLWQGFEGTNHTVSHYKSELTEKLARFNASGVMDVGREDEVTAANEHVQVAGRSNSPFVDYTSEDNPKSVTRDRTIVALRFLSGRPTQYATAHRDFQTQGVSYRDPKVNEHQKREGVYMSPGYDHQPHAQDGEYVTAWRDYTATGKDKSGKTITVQVQREFHIERLIDPEFAEIAVDRHNAQWQHAPREIVVDDRIPRYQDGAPMPADYKPEGHYIVTPSAAYKPEDPTTWWGFQEQKFVGSKY